MESYDELPWNNKKRSWSKNFRNLKYESLPVKTLALIAIIGFIFFIFLGICDLEKAHGADQGAEKELTAETTLAVLIFDEDGNLIYPSVLGDEKFFFPPEEFFKKSLAV